MTREQLARAGVEIDPSGYERLSGFVALLMRENRRLNLTGARNASDIWAAHVCDSLALLPWLRRARPRTLLDLGSGGGLPGVPLACVCEKLGVTLLDSTRKKVDAVGRICAELALPNVTGVWARAETLAHDPRYRETFDAVAARAVARLPIAIELAAGLARPGGTCWFFQSAKAVPREIEASSGPVETCGLQFAALIEYELPAGHGRRVLLGYDKRAPLPAHLPRPPRLAAKRPL